MAHIHLYHIKETVMLVAKQEPLPGEFHDITLFAGLPQHTSQQKKKLAIITKTLRSQQIQYKWGYPTKIILTRNVVTSLVLHLVEGLKLLQKWQITLIVETQQPCGIPSKICPEYDKVTRLIHTSTTLNELSMHFSAK